MKKITAIVLMFLTVPGIVSTSANPQYFSNEFIFIGQVLEVGEIKSYGPVANHTPTGQRNVVIRVEELLKGETTETISGVVFTEPWEEFNDAINQKYLFFGKVNPWHEKENIGIYLFAYLPYKEAGHTIKKFREVKKVIEGEVGGVMEETYMVDYPIIDGRSPHRKYRVEKISEDEIEFKEFYDGKDLIEKTLYDLKGRLITAYYYDYKGKLYRTVDGNGQKTF